MSDAGAAHGYQNRLCVRGRRVASPCVAQMILPSSFIKIFLKDALVAAGAFSVLVEVEIEGSILS